MASSKPSPVCASPHTLPCAHRVTIEQNRSEDTALSHEMPPPDLDSVLYGSGESEEYDDPYAPAESLRLRIGEDIDWSDVGVAAVLERDDSTKGAGANPKSAARRSAVARSSLSAAALPKAAVAAVIGGLPAASKNKTAREHGRRSSCRLGRARVFAAGEAVDHQAEPASPKVSCLGGVTGVRLETWPAGEGSSRRGWWSWFVGNVMCCCSDGRCAWRPRGSGAD
ncbi:uncharacterized protein LOC133922037 [Phragmites australis]|uniref:uncharacterized protein LOC133922037 n=1 Tax=Phragmites australis TaxID=29695 RepID=UPI002D77044B|nr:uncharacterized protein LOC133922037 [Phragmites australis]